MANAICKNCGGELSRIKLAKDDWRWSHVDHEGYQTETGDMGIPCNLSAEPIRPKDEKKARLVL